MDLRNHVLDGVEIPMGKSNFGVVWTTDEHCELLLWCMQQKALFGLHSGKSDSTRVSVLCCLLGDMNGIGTVKYLLQLSVRVVFLGPA